jgi:MFS family permease
MGSGFRFHNMSIGARIRGLGFPRQFWLLFWGMLLNTAGTSMVWPFMTIYLRQRLDVPLTTVTLLMTLNSLAGLASVAVAGPVIDRVGRKGAMVAGLAAGSAVMLTMSAAGTLPLWAGLMAAQGAVMPLYRVGADAMIADLIPAAGRPNAYALLRMVTNLGIAIGPSVGGFVAAKSYGLAFGIGAGAMATFALLILVLARETMPGKRAATARPTELERTTISGDPKMQDRGYGPVLRDSRFMAFTGLLVLATIPAAMLMVLLPVYAKEQFGVPENRYGFIMATNAAMVVLLQYAVTRVSKRYRPAGVLGVGALLYAVGVGSVAWGRSFPTFLASMVVLTFGELLLVPTATAYTATLAPAEMRGRYMGVYNLTWGVGYGLGPVIGGLLSDRMAPVATWYGGLGIGLAAVVGFAAMWRKAQKAHDVSENVESPEDGTSEVRETLTE